ncbi:MAG: poly-gamma-glutamate system protein [Candidatus Hydrothermales bacterium]
MVLRRRLNNFDFLILFLIGVLFFIIEQKTLIKKPVRYYKLKEKSAILTHKAFLLLKEEFIKRGGVIDSINDPGKTGLIGLRSSLITEEEAAIETKLTSINPNFSALFIDFFKKLNLKKGDYIAVSLTGSFPALNILLIISAEVLGLKPIIITSLSSSAWGANHPFWTYLDMENFLHENKMIKSKTVAASIGGINDAGMGLEEEGRNILKKAIERNNIPIFINENSLEKSIEKRIKIYDSLSNGNIKLFISIGEGIADLGFSDMIYYLKSGINDPYDRKIDFNKLPVKGVIVRFLEKGIPVISIHNIMAIAKKYNMPISPIEMPKACEGSLFFEEKYSVPLVILQLLVLIFLLFLILRFDIIYILKKKKIEDSV